MCFIIVFYDDFTVIYGLLRGGADEVIVIAVVNLSNANIGLNVALRVLIAFPRTFLTSPLNCGGAGHPASGYLS
jgi:hypothetical protein